MENVHKGTELDIATLKKIYFYNDSKNLFKITMGITIIANILFFIFGGRYVDGIMDKLRNLSMIVKGNQATLSDGTVVIFEEPVYELSIFYYIGCCIIFAILLSLIFVLGYIVYKLIREVLYDNPNIQNGTFYYIELKELTNSNDFGIKITKKIQKAMADNDKQSYILFYSLKQGKYPDNLKKCFRNFVTIQP